MMTLQQFLREWNDGGERILVHTSGSTGTPKPLWVEKRRMEASARITCDFLGLHEGNTALLCMPLDYIAGKMMVVRSLVRGLRLLSVEPSGHPLANVQTKVDFAAMVPLQVWNSLQVETERERLRAIGNLIIGGGAIDDQLAAELRGFPNAVWSTYGMTETLSHIALRRLSGSGASEWYTPFEGVDVSLSPDGCLVIEAPQVCAERLVTNDLAELTLKPHTQQKMFRILGRRDNVVCTGGLKIQIEEAERLLRPHLRDAFLITKCRDKRLGEAMVLLTEGSVDDELRQLCHRVLPPHWAPRHYVHVARLPQTETGKPARAEAQRIASQACQN